jgi:hypothetical protein
MKSYLICVEWYRLNIHKIIVFSIIIYSIYQQIIVDTIPVL